MLGRDVRAQGLKGLGNWRRLRVLASTQASQGIHSTYSKRNALTRAYASWPHRLSTTVDHGPSQDESSNLAGISQTRQHHTGMQNYKEVQALSTHIELIVSDLCMALLK